MRNKRSARYKPTTAGSRGSSSKIADLQVQMSEATSRMNAGMKKIEEHCHGICQVKKQVKKALKEMRTIKCDMEFLDPESFGLRRESISWDPIFLVVEPKLPLSMP